MGEGPDNFTTVLDLCRDEHRRIVLAVLAEERCSLMVNDLTKVILKYNQRTPVTEVSEEVLTQIQLSLHHVHIPTLESAGAIEYDPKCQHVEPTAQFDQLQPYLDVILNADPGLEEPIEL